MKVAHCLLTVVLLIRLKHARIRADHQKFWIVRKPYEKNHLKFFFYIIIFVLVV